MAVMQRRIGSFCLVLLLCSLGNGQSSTKPTQAERATTTPSIRVGNLLVSVTAMAILAPQQFTPENHYRLSIGGTVKNIGQSAVCAVIHAKLEPRDKVADPIRVLVGSGPLRKLERGQLVGVMFEAFVKDGANPSKLTITEEEPENGCTDVSGATVASDGLIPLTSVPRPMLKPIF